jgi:TniQ
MLPHRMPVCPRPYAQEALQSWHTRIGEGYALTSDELVSALGLQPIEGVPQTPTLHALAVAAELPAADLAKMSPGAAGWLLSSATEIAVCPRCLREDRLAHRVDPYGSGRPKPQYSTLPDEFTERS